MDGPAAQPAASHAPSPDARTGTWLYVDLDSAPGKMSCRGRGCS